MRQLQIRLILRWAGILFFVGFAFVGAGCSTGTILASHEPMHPNDRPVTLKAVTTGNVDRIEFRVQRFALEFDGLTWAETALTPVLYIWACDPPGSVKSLTCSHELAFSGDGQIVEFHARAVYPGGGHADEVYRFASGDFPIEGMPVPVRMKRRPENGIDIVFVPHTNLVPADDPDALTFRTHLDDIVDGTLFEYEVIRNNRALYNFWYSPIAVDFDAEDCNSLDDPLGIELESIADISMYVHYESKRNCALGAKLTTELWYDKSVIHELGHALAGLRDEYSVSTSTYGPRNHMPNTFGSKAECEQEAPLLGLSPARCQLSTPVFNFWRIDPTGADGCMMGPSQHLSWSDFGPACTRRFNWRYSQCLQGDCIASPDDTDGGAEMPKEENEPRL